VNSVQFYAGPHLNITDLGEYELVKRNIKSRYWHQTETETFPDILEIDTKAKFSKILETSRDQDVKTRPHVRSLSLVTTYPG